MKRHTRTNYYVVGEGVLTEDKDHKQVQYRPSTTEELRRFRFSRIGPKGTPVSRAVLEKVAIAMTVQDGQPDASNPIIPAGFTYLGQFVDHDMTFDKTAVELGENVRVDKLLQGRSPALDLDSLYGDGPLSPLGSRFYADSARLKMGETVAVGFPDIAPGPARPAETTTNRPYQGFDLPRSGQGSSKAERRAAVIPDPRNDENLIVAQTHLAFIRFHNRVVDLLAEAGTPSADLFEKAREQVTKHYQWMLKTDFLPRIVKQGVLDEVFNRGRRFFEVPIEVGRGPSCSYMHVLPGDRATMPVEFSVAAYRLGHSMIRGAYQWNRVFKAGGPGGIASLMLLFRFSATSGTLSPPPDPAPVPEDADLDSPESGGFEKLPSNWITDFRRLFNFEAEVDGAAAAGLVPPEALNRAKRVDTKLVDPLALLPLGSFDSDRKPVAALDRNLAFRNLLRANMVELASGQQMAELFGVPKLSESELLTGSGDGADLSTLTGPQKAELMKNTPLWFYILREAELNGGLLGDVGGRIVAEVFHRSMEVSRYSIIRDATWRPDPAGRFNAPDANTYRMVDMLLCAFEGKASLLNPLGD